MTKIVVRVARWFQVIGYFAVVGMFVFMLAIQEWWPAVFEGGVIVVLSLGGFAPKRNGAALPQGLVTRYGWRGWMLNKSMTSAATRLVGVVYHDMWQRGVSYASCSHHRKGCHGIPPCEGGSCGLYARLYCNGLFFAPVLGVVALGGRVITHKDGFRAAHAMPLVLFADQKSVTVAQAQALEDWYEVPVHRGKLYKFGIVGTRRWVRELGQEVVEACVEEELRER